MKKKLHFIVASAIMLSFPNISFGQTPTLGIAANYVLYTSAGDVGNTGISQVTGNVGTNVGAFSGFGNVNGVMNSANAAALQCSVDLASTCTQINASTTTAGHGAVLGNAEVLTAGVYSIAAAGSAAGTLSLDAVGNPNALFIFKIGGAFTTGAATKVVLMNGALACNVFWKVEGAVALAAGTVMKGTLIANNAAASMAAGCMLEGRLFSTAGAIAIDGALAYLPLGCGSPTLTGPTLPALASTECYALFSSNGAVTNTAVTNVTGDVGTNIGLTSGFTASNVIGTIHTNPDANTAACANDLALVYTSLNALTSDIELLFPAQLGNKLVLTPHTYTLNTATMLSDTLYLNAQNNINAVFVISVNGALTTAINAKVILINGAQAKNVFWLVNGNVNINNNSVFKGTIVCGTGSINLGTGVMLDGRALTKMGDVTTNSITATKPSICVSTGIKLLDDNLEISVYPNPFSSSLTINLNNIFLTGNTHLYVYNMLGELIMNTPITQSQNNIETSNLHSGLYFYKLLNENKIIGSGKLISYK
jgi:hypothetical protein